MVSSGRRVGRCHEHGAGKLLDLERLQRLDQPARALDGDLLAERVRLAGDIAIGGEMSGRCDAVTEFASAIFFHALADGCREQRHADLNPEKPHRPLCPGRLAARHEGDIRGERADEAHDRKRQEHRMERVATNPCRAAGIPMRRMLGVNILHGLSPSRNLDSRPPQDVPQQSFICAA
jgi:hypothetical protein